MEPPARKAPLVPGSRGKGVEVRDPRLETLAPAAEGDPGLLPGLS